MESWYDQWLRALGSAVIVGPSDFAGQIPADRASPTCSRPSAAPVARLESRLTILSDGAIVACEQDVLGRHRNWQGRRGFDPRYLAGERLHRMRTDARIARNWLETVRYSAPGAVNGIVPVSQDTGVRLHANPWNHPRPRRQRWPGNKHLLPLLGKPVISYTFDHARAVARLDRVVVSSDCPQILELARAEWLRHDRAPAHLATSDASVQDAMLHAMRTVEADDRSNPMRSSCSTATSPFVAPA